MPVAHAQMKIMTNGDSITEGFPDNDSISYHNTLTARLPAAPIYVGDPVETITADGMPVSQYMVGRDGDIIEKLPIVHNSSPSGAVARFENARNGIITNGGVNVLNYVVILLGINDLARLINPKNLDDWFMPGVDVADFPLPLPAENGDYRSARIFIDGGVNREIWTYDNRSNFIPVNSILDRYQKPLDAIGNDDPNDAIPDAFPITHVILVTVPIPGASLDGSDDQYEESRRSLVKETVEN
jgi:hypothetical protein